MITIGTRGSELALWQARWVQAQLGGEAAGVRLEIIKTTGDRILDVPLQGQLYKGFFTKELEAALLDKRVDLAVHSLKDLPTEMPEGLHLATVTQRADEGDVLLVRPDAVASGHTGAFLPLKSGATVGTSSLRRQALVQHLAPDAKVLLLRGNVPTRLRKCQEGEYDAVILARAGIGRLGLDPGELAVFDLTSELWLPAPAQGALGLQTRADDTALIERLQVLHHAPTATAVGLERGLLRRIEGGCHSAFGALGTVSDDGAWARLRAGASDAAGAWQTIDVSGAPDDLVERAFDALQIVLAGGVPAASTDAEVPWFQPARRWS